MDIEAMKGKPRNGTRPEPNLILFINNPTGGVLIHTWMSIYKQIGCLIKHSTQRMGKPCTRGRT